MRNKKTSSVFLFRILLQHNSIFSQKIFNCLILPRKNMDQPHRNVLGTNNCRNHQHRYNIFLSIKSPLVGVSCQSR